MSLNYYCCLKTADKSVFCSCWGLKRETIQILSPWIFFLFFFNKTFVYFMSVCPGQHVLIPACHVLPFGHSPFASDTDTLLASLPRRFNFPDAQGPFGIRGWCAKPSPKRLLPKRSVYLILTHMDYVTFVKVRYYTLHQNIGDVLLSLVSMEEYPWSLLSGGMVIGLLNKQIPERKS